MSAPVPQSILPQIPKDKLYEMLVSLPNLSDGNATPGQLFEQKQGLTDALEKSRPTAASLMNYLATSKKINEEAKTFDKTVDLNIESNKRVATYMAIYPDILQAMTLSSLLGNLHQGEPDSINNVLYSPWRDNNDYEACAQNYILLGDCGVFQARYFANTSNFKNLHDLKLDMVTFKLQQLEYQVSQQEMESFISANLVGGSVNWDTRGRGNYFYKPALPILAHMAVMSDKLNVYDLKVRKHCIAGLADPNQRLEKLFCLVTENALDMHAKLKVVEASDFVKNEELRKTLPQEQPEAAPQVQPEPVPQTEPEVAKATSVVPKAAAEKPAPVIVVTAPSKPKAKRSYTRKPKSEAVQANTVEAVDFEVVTEVPPPVTIVKAPPASRSGMVTYKDILPFITPITTEKSEAEIEAEEKIRELLVPQQPVPVRIFRNPSLVEPQTDAKPKKRKVTETVQNEYDLSSPAEKFIAEKDAMINAGKWQKDYSIKSRAHRTVTEFEDVTDALFGLVMPQEGSVPVPLRLGAKLY